MDRGVEDHEELRRSVQRVREGKTLPLTTDAPRDLGRRAAGPCLATCGGDHPRLDVIDAALMIRSLYGAGIPYSKIADLTNLGLSHLQMSQVVGMANVVDMAQVLGFFA